MRRSPRNLAVALIAATALALAACGDEEDEVEVPSGFTERSVDAGDVEVAVSYPDDWGELEDAEVGGEYTFEASGPGGEGLELRVLDNDNSFEANSTATGAVTAVNTGFQVEISDREETEVDGAAVAERISFAPGELSDDETGSLAALAAQTEEEGGRFVLVAVGAPADVDVDADAILGSVRITDAGE